MDKKIEREKEFLLNISEFLQVILNIILFEQKIYPEIAFEPKLLYGVSIHVAKQTSLNIYINDLFKNIEKLLESDSLQMIQIHLKNNNNLIQRYDFKIDKQLKFQNFEHIPQKFEQDIYFKNMIVNLIEDLQNNQFNIFTQNQQNNSFEIQIITNDEINIQGQYNLIENWNLDQKNNSYRACLNNIDVINFAEFSISLSRLFDQ